MAVGFCGHCFLLFLFWVSPGIFTQGTSRVVNFNKEFPVEAPFRFVLNNTSLEVMEGEDVMIDLLLEGQELPEKVFINSDQGKFLMERSQKNAFQIILPQVRRDTKFYFTSGEFMSDSYQLKVLGKAAVGKLNASIIYILIVLIHNKERIRDQYSVVSAGFRLSTKYTLIKERLSNMTVP